MKNLDKTYRSERGEFDKRFPVHHYHCEDPWYSCPLAEGGCTDDDVEQGVCNCGATEEHEQFWRWHIQTKIKLLNKINSEVVGQDEDWDMYSDEAEIIPKAHRNELRETQRSKLQSLQKELASLSITEGEK